MLYPNRNGPNRNSGHNVGRGCAFCDALPQSPKYDLHCAASAKGAWRMPWLTEAMKDAISCDKPRLGANDP